MNSFADLEKLIDDPTNNLRYEAVTGKRIDQTVEKYRNTIGLFCILGSASAAGYATDRVFNLFGFTNYVFTIITYIADVLAVLSVGMAVVKPSLQLGSYIGMRRVKSVLQNYY